MNCRTLIRSTATAMAGLFAGLAGAVHAQDKLTFTTNWFAEAEHGGFYQALATGLYRKAGLDVTIRMGGPQVNSMQLLAAGQTDLIMGYDFQTMKAHEQGIQAVTIGVSFQKDPQGLMTHEDITGIERIKGHTILAASSAFTSWWPWLKAKYGLDDGMTRPYTFNVQPFLADKSLVQQGYVTSEPFGVDKVGMKHNFYLFADAGYPPYAETMVTLQRTIDARPDVLARFVRASIEGWKSYMTENNASANALIRKDNPGMTDEQIVYSIRKMREFRLLDAGEAASAGIGAMSDARFKQSYDLMVAGRLLDPAKVDLAKTYTTRFMKDVKVLLQ